MFSSAMQIFDAKGSSSIVLIALLKIRFIAIKNVRLILGS
jgi:hypothetical protein